MATKVQAQISDSLFRVALNALSDKSCESAVVSPFSIGMALAVLNVGAKGNTSQEITEAAFNGIPKNQITAWFREQLGRIHDLQKNPLGIASGIYLDESLMAVEKFRVDIAQNFDSHFEKVDFVNNPEIQRAALNAFVKEVTMNEIPALFSNSDITSDTKVIIVNAMHLASAFMSAFNEENTKEEMFYNEDGSTKEILTMSGTKEGQYFENEEFQLAQLSFEDQGFSFLFMVPKTGTLEELKEKLFASNSVLSTTLSSTQKIPKIHISIPKFKVEASYDLKDALQRQGIIEVFEAGQANLTGISEDPLNVSGVIHKSVFDLHEGGVKAAAATAIVAVKCMMMPMDPEERTIKAEKPFLYGVTYNGAPLFVGQFY